MIGKVEPLSAQLPDPFAGDTWPRAVDRAAADRRFAPAASASALFVGVLQAVLDAPALGAAFRTGVASGLLVIAGLVVASGTAVGGVLLQLRNPAGHTWWRGVGRCWFLPWWPMWS
uniref:Uncharacterized protein n=1 Tax=Thermocrispum agreste TaxID=37925 RepID=A0A2W4LF06_9PSEU|nr:MAG: hypothetical protein DIU77_05330 [Thermocrispum agreste]